MGCHFFSPGDLPNPGMESGSPALQEDSLLSEPPGKQWFTLNWKVSDLDVQQHRESILCCPGCLMCDELAFVGPFVFTGWD